jgi:hypothetical protein
VLAELGSEDSEARELAVAYKESRLIAKPAAKRTIASAANAE